MAATWKIVGTSQHAKEADRDVIAFRLDGDVSTLIVPLRWPISKHLEEYLIFNSAAKIRQLWQVLVAQSEEPDKPGFVAFPDTDDKLRDVYWPAGGGVYETFPWDVPGQVDLVKPTNWAAMVRNWYMEQGWYNARDLVRAFGEAMEALTGLPLAQSAPSLHSYLLSGDSGVDVSAPKPASTLTAKKTGPRSGRRSTGSSPARLSASKTNAANGQSG